MSSKKHAKSKEPSVAPTAAPAQGAGQSGVGPASEQDRLNGVLATVEKETAAALKRLAEDTPTDKVRTKRVRRKMQKSLYAKLGRARRAYHGQIDRDLDKEFPGRVANRRALRQYLRGYGVDPDWAKEKLNKVAEISKRSLKAA